MLLYGISWYHAPGSYWYYRSDPEWLTWQKMETRRRKKRYFCWTSSLSPTGPFAHRISWVGENKMVQCKSFYYPRLPCWRSPFYHHKRFYLTTWCGLSDEARVHWVGPLGPLQQQNSALYQVWKLLSSQKNLLWIHFKGSIPGHHHLSFSFKVRNNLTWVSRSRLHGKVSNNITWYLIYSVHRPREKDDFLETIEHKRFTFLQRPATGWRIKTCLSKKKYFQHI